jgi:hypothetical protein
MIVSEISLNVFTLKSSIGSKVDIKLFPAPENLFIISLARPSGPIVDKGA